MTAAGLRERKKTRMRQQIAAAAARLFADRGYENVSVVEVARAADVSEKTVYNYFPTKQSLAFDRDEEIRRRWSDLIRSRPPGSSAALAVRDAALTLADCVAAIPDDELHGSLGSLATLSPTIRRLCLESTDLLADALAEALIQTNETLTWPLAKAHGIALAWVNQTCIDEAGRLIAAGHDRSTIATELHEAVQALLDDLQAHGI